MITRPFLTCTLLWTGCATLAVATAFGCSSSSSPEPAGSPDSGTGSDSHAASETSTGSDSGGTGDTSTSNDGQGVELHDGGAPAPDAMYGACAVMGGFGWPCSASTTGPDPTDCTDPTFPDCFVGGQGAWCTKTCSTGADCTQVEDAGCAPSDCNGKGYCK